MHMGKMKIFFLTVGRNLDSSFIFFEFVLMVDDCIRVLRCQYRNTSLKKWTSQKLKIMSSKNHSIAFFHFPEHYLT